MEHNIRPGLAGAFDSMYLPPELPNSNYIDPNQAFQGDQGASQLLGQLNRAQWNDWKARYAPYITRLADEATDPNAAQNAARQA